MDSKIVNKMNAKQRRQARIDAQEEAYYKGLEAPKTSFVDTGNGITEVQTNSDQNEPISQKQVKPTTLQNYKPVETAQPEVKPEPEVKEEVKPEPEPEPEPTVQPEVDNEPDTDVSQVVEPVTEETIAEAGINPNNSPEQNQKGTENAISEITGKRNSDGTYTPLNKMQYADNLQKFGVFATIASIGLAVLTKGAFPPVDFSAFTGLNESYAKYVEGIDNYNKYVREAQGKTAYENERAKQDQNITNKAADLDLTVENKQKERDTNYQAFLKNLDAANEQSRMKLANDLNIALQSVLTEGQLQVINANAEVQKAVLDIMYKQDINRAKDNAKVLLDAGFSMKDLNSLAQFAKSQQGQTYYENILRGFNALNEGVRTGIEATKGTGFDDSIRQFFKRMLKF